MVHRPRLGPKTSAIGQDHHEQCKCWLGIIRHDQRIPPQPRAKNRFRLHHPPHRRLCLGWDYFIEGRITFALNNIIWPRFCRYYLRRFIKIWDTKLINSFNCMFHKQWWLYWIAKSTILAKASPCKTSLYIDNESAKAGEDQKLLVKTKSCELLERYHRNIDHRHNMESNFL